MNRRALIWLTIAVVVAGVIAVPFLLPLDTYRGSLQSAASRALGRDVKIQGAMHLTVYPDIGLSLADVTIANAKGAKNADIASIGKVTVGARLLPLLSGRLEVTGITLDQPVVHLEMNREGRANWEIEQPQGAGQAGVSRRATDATEFNRIGLSHLRINAGRITYADARSGKDPDSVEDVSLRLDFPEGARTLAAPLAISGSLAYHGEKLTLSGHLDNLDAVLKGRGTGAHLTVGSTIINADFEGTVGQPGRTLGALKLGARSLRAFANWLGHPMPPGNGFGLIALEGQIVQQDSVFTLRHAHLAFDSMNVNGDLSLDTSTEPLTITGHTAIDRLDVRPYLAPGAQEDTVKAARATANQPDAPIALDWLKSANADLTLVLGGLVLPHMTLDQAVVKLALKKAVLNASLDTLSLYGGTGKGTITVDASGDLPSFRHSLDLSGVKVQPFLGELMDVSRISGVGAVRLDVASRGQTPAAIVKALNGKAEVKFTDGSITGIDLASAARVVQSVLTAQILSDVLGDGATTAFGRLGASFAIKNGVMHTSDFTLVSPTVQMSGRGDIDLSQHALDLRFEPKALKGLPGVKLVDIGVPFYVRGPWQKPSITPDASGIAKGVINKLKEGAAAPADLLTKPGSALKALLGQ